MNSELLHVEILDNGISTTDAAQAIASNLHSELSAIVVVNSPATQAVATGHARAAQTFLKDLEASRKSVKQPILELGRKIDALADELAAPVKEQMNRVGQMVAKFQTAEAMRVEQERKEREKAEAAAMEAARKAAEEAYKAAEAMKDESGLQGAINAEVEALLKRKEMYATLTAPQPSAIKAKGSVTKKILKYEVTDLAAAYAAAPHLFSIEIKPSAVNATCTVNSKIAGIRFWEELVSSFKSL
jgi:hypothetical protein